MSALCSSPDLRFSIHGTRFSCHVQEDTRPVIVPGFVAKALQAMQFPSRPQGS